MVRLGASRYIVRVREYDGAYESRGPWGVRRGIRWGAWKTVASFDTFDAASDHARSITGLRDVAVFFRGKRVERSEA